MRKCYFYCVRRGVQKDLIDEFYEFRQSVNRYTIGPVVLTEPVVSVIRRELRKIKDGLKVSNEEIEELVANEVLKRDLVESEAAKRGTEECSEIVEETPPIQT